MKTEYVNYLEMLQAVINRLAGNSFAIKGWSVTVSTGTLAYLLKDGVPGVAYLALLPCVMFAWLDSYYLCLEKRLRNRFKEAVEPARVNGVPSFNLSPLKCEGDVQNTLKSTSIWLFHGCLLLVIVLVAALGPSYISGQLKAGDGKTVGAPAKAL